MLEASSQDLRSTQRDCVLRLDVQPGRAGGVLGAAAPANNTCEKDSGCSALLCMQVPELLKHDSRSKRTDHVLGWLCSLAVQAACWDQQRHSWERHKVLSSALLPGAGDAEPRLQEQAERPRAAAGCAAGSSRRRAWARGPVRHAEGRHQGLL